MFKLSGCDINEFNRNMIFIGNLHGTITATQLKFIFEDLFGPVAYILIDTDRYPVSKLPVVVLTLNSHIS